MKNETVIVRIVTVKKKINETVLRIILKIINDNLFRTIKNIVNIKDI